MRMREHRSLLSRAWRVACAVGLGIIAGCQQSPSRLARMHMADDQREEARKRWDAMRGGARLQLAEKHLRAGRLKEAMAELQATLETAPDHPKAHLTLARVYLEQGELAKAQESVNRAARLSDDAEADYVAGIVAERYDDAGAALACYQRALAKSPLTVEYVLATAETLVTMRRPADALALLTSRMQDFEGSAPIRLLAAEVERTLGLREPAVEHCAEALRLAPDDPSTVIEYGMALAWAERHAEAIAVLRPVYDTETSKRRNVETPKSEDGNREGIPDKSGCEKGCSHQRKSSKQPAAEDPPSVVYALARCYLATGKAAEAVRVLDAAAEESTDTILPSLLAGARLAAGDAAGALEALRTLEARGGLNAEACLAGAYAESSRKDFAGVERYARMALELDAGLGTAHCLLGQAAEARGMMEAARQAYQEALAVEPGSDLAKGLLCRLDARAEAERPRVTPRSAESREASGAAQIKAAAPGRDEAPRAIADQGPLRVPHPDPLPKGEGTVGAISNLRFEIAARPPLALLGQAVESGPYGGSVAP